jgi:hypothetical protein
MKVLSLTNRLYSRIVRLPFGWKTRRFLSNFVNLLIRKYQRQTESTQIYSDLEANGYAVLGKLSTEDTEHLTRLVRENLGKEEVNETDPDLNTGIFYADEKSLIDDPGFRAIILQKRIKNIADSYLRSNSSIIGCSAWLSRATDHRQSVNAQNFHRDIDTIRWLKVFIYLTDVNELNGPHIFVPKSHKNNHYKKYARLTEADLLEKGLSPIEIYGEAGTILVVDTFGIHRGKPVVDNERLLAQVTFGTLPVVYKKYPLVNNIPKAEHHLWSYYL